MSALFFDIDGTILSEITHKIPESALEALHKAQENGHKTFINKRFALFNRYSGFYLPFPTNIW